MQWGLLTFTYMQVGSWGCWALPQQLLRQEHQQLLPRQPEQPHASSVVALQLRGGGPQLAALTLLEAALNAWIQSVSTTCWQQQMVCMQAQSRPHDLTLSVRETRCLLDLATCVCCTSRPADNLLLCCGPSCAAVERDAAELEAYEAQHPDRMRRADLTEDQDDLICAWWDENYENLDWESRGDTQNQLEGQWRGCHAQQQCGLLPAPICRAIQVMPVSLAWPWRPGHP
jgi:hypothetical protein